MIDTVWFAKVDIGSAARAGYGRILCVHRNQFMAIVTEGQIGGPSCLVVTELRQLWFPFSIKYQNSSWSITSVEPRVIARIPIKQNKPVS